MLLEFAAQAKCRSQRSLARTAVAISHAPAEVKTILIQFKQELVTLITQLQDSIAEMKERRAAKAKEKKKIEQTERRLKAATELLKKNDTLIAKMDGNQTTQSSAAVETPEQPKESQEKLEEINSQIAKLREQMELFAKLQAMSAQVNQQAEATAAPTPEVPEAPKMDIPQAPPLEPVVAVDVPVAPPLGDFSLQFTGHAKLAVEIPLAPPFSPPSKPALKSHNRQNSVSTAVQEPSYRRSVEPASHCQPSFSTGPIASSTPSHIRQPSATSIPTAPLSEITSPRSLRSPSARQSSGNTLTVPLASHSSRVSQSQKPNLKVFTRKIPGEDALSHNDLIRVAAAVKLRKTQIPRSPGGTPARTRSHLNDPFAEALFQKFRLANRRSDNFERKSTAPNAGNANFNVNTNGMVEDKENWETN